MANEAEEHGDAGEERRARPAAPGGVRRLVRLVAQLREDPGGRVAAAAAAAATTRARAHRSSVWPDALTPASLRARCARRSSQAKSSRSRSFAGSVQSSSHHGSVAGLARRLLQDRATFFAVVGVRLCEPERVVVEDPERFDHVGDRDPAILENAGRSRRSSCRRNSRSCTNRSRRAPSAGRSR